MPSFFQQIFTLLTTNPGNLAYQLVLAFSIAGALSPALLNWSRNSAQSSRLLTGLGFLLALRLGLFIYAALSWQNILTTPHLLPPLDRGINLLSVIIIIWLWAFPNPQKFGDAASALLGLLIITLSAIGLVWWAEQGQIISFNGSWLDLTAAAIGAGLCLLGILILFLSRTEGWGIGFGMIGLLLIGYMSHFLFPLPEGDFSGAIRLTQMAAFPLLFALPHLIPLPTFNNTQPDKPQQRSQEQPQGFDLQFIRPVLDMASANTPETVFPAMARLVSHLMAADVCLVVDLLEPREHMRVRGGFILSKDQEIQSFPISSPLGYTVSNAIRRGRPLRLPASSTADDELGLGSMLGVNRLGHLLAVPIFGPNQTVSTGLILIAPYTLRGWSSVDQDTLIALAEQLAQFLQLTEQTGNLHKEIKKAGIEVEESKRQIEQIQRENEILLSRLEETRQYSAKEHTRAESLAALVATNESTYETIQKLEAEVQRWKEAAETSVLPDKFEAGALEAELHLALEEIAQLKSILSEADLRLMEQQLVSGIPAELGKKQEVAASIIHEIRQPMSSILEYTELLLEDPSGHLTLNQRKYLERMKASLRRMEGLLDDLLQVSISPAYVPEESAQQGIDINAVIDEAIALTMGQMREKKIILRVDIPQHLPPIKADREALQQTIIHLLQNANSVTRIEGEISLHARLRNEEGKPDFIFLQITDQGGGIPDEELPRVFSRLQGAKQAAISGIGETGLGLAMAKTLVEAQAGQIWVETEKGTGSTFCVLLPTTSKAVSNNGYGVMPA